MAPPPTSSKPKTTRVYILRFRLPAGLNVRKRKELGKPTTGHSVSTTYILDHEMRRKVLSRRAHFRYLAFRYSIPFYGLRLVREDDLPSIERMVAKAQESFHVLYDSWKTKLAKPSDAPSYEEVFGGIRAVPIPVDLDPNREGGKEMYQAVHDAVASHVYERIVERLQKLSKRKSEDLTDKSRRALLELTKKLKGWNVLGSKDIEDTLETAAKRFAEKNLDPVMDDLEAQVKKLSSEGSWVEL